MTVAVACPPDGDLPEWLASSGIEHLRWKASRSPGPWSIAEARALRSLVRAYAPDVLHLHSSKAGLAGRMGTKLAPIVIFQPHAWSFEATKGFLRSSSLLWERIAARRADAIVCVSDAERDGAAGLGVRGRFRVIPNGIDLDAWSFADDDEKRRARSRLELGDEPLVVCVGRLSEQKGQDILVAAWSRVRSLVRDARLALVGDGPLRASLEEATATDVMLIGKSDDVSSWLAAADVVAMPSRWEGMSLTMLEAMARGRSVVAADVAGAREAIRDGAGAVVPVGDVDALASELASRLRDEEKARAEGKRAREVVSSRFDLRATLAAIADLYGELSRQPNA